MLLGMLLGTLEASFLGSMLTEKGILKADKGMIRAGYGNKPGKGVLRSGHGSSIKKKLIPSHPLTNFKIKKYYRNELRFNGVYSRDNWPKIIKDGAYLIKLDEYGHVGTHWIALYVEDIETIYFDIFGVEYVPKEIKKFIGDKSRKTNIFRIQADNAIMSGYFYIEFIDFMFAGKTLIDYTSLFSPDDFEKNDNIILSYFKKE